MDPKLIQIIDVASKHPEFDQEKVDSEAIKMEEYGVVNDLYSLFLASQDRGPYDGNSINSCIVYYANITTAPPSGEFTLTKRRTYGRDGWPDIDMDFCYERRPEILDYIIDKYGRERVGNIGVVQTLKMKNTIRRVIKVLDPINVIKFDEDGKQISGKSENFQFENEVMNTLPGFMKRPDGTPVKTIKEAYEEYPDFRKYMNHYPDVYQSSLAIERENVIGGYGCHAAGVIISPFPLSDIAPLHVTTDYVDNSDTKEKMVATQFPMKDIESLGLIKFDILGLSTLTAVDYALKLIKENHGVDIDLRNLPLDDRKALDLLKSGLTDGVFQCENHGMKETLKQIGIDSFDDLVIAVAMFRPGPKDYIPELAQRKKGDIPIQYPHQMIKKFTEKTYGIICYQETVMQAFMALAGLTESDGYTFLKGCAKKDPDLIAKFKDVFINNTISRGVEEATVLKIWADLEKFAGYSFNKSHSVSYAYLGYQTAYLKAHYPTEFMVARLTVETKRRNFDKISSYEGDCRHHLSLRILDPDINESKIEWLIVNDYDIRKPILCKGVGAKAAEEIVANQPYATKDTLFDFASKVGASVNTKVMEALWDMGVWKKHAKSKKELLKSFEDIKADMRRSRGKPSGNIC